MSRMSDHERAYLAGFFDGEGSVGIYTRGKVFPVMSVTIVQNSSPVVDALFLRWSETLGGSFYKRLSESGRAKLQWQATGANAVTILEEMLPYLILKREQAELCLRWESLKSGVRRGKNGRLLPSEWTTEHHDLIRRVKELKREPVLTELPERLEA